MDLSHIRLLFQAITMLISLFFLKKYKTKFLQLLSIYLVMTFLVEVIGVYYVQVKRKSSFLYYYFYTFLAFINLSLIYFKLIKSKFKYNVFLPLTLCFFAFGAYVFFNKSLFFYVIITYEIIISFYIFLYLRELLLSDYIISYKESLPFWVSVGFIVFYLPSIPFFSFGVLMRDRLFLPILNSLLILMNGIISFGLLWSNKKEEF